jgi:hypothetical protein
MFYSLEIIALLWNAAAAAAAVISTLLFYFDMTDIHINLLQFC